MLKRILLIAIPAVIGGICLIMATIVTGVFNISNTLVEKSIPSSQEKIISTPAPIISTACASLTFAQIEQLKNQQDIPSAIKQAEKFAGYHQYDYQQGSQIPANVVIATNLYSDPSNFPVSLIRNEGGSGLFLTLASFTAPNAGTYWCVQP